MPTNLGGLTLRAGTTDRLLIGGAANVSSGALYEIGLVRDAEGHITGFSGSAERFADAANNDGGIAYGPGGVLFLARYPLVELGQTNPGSAATDKIINLREHNVGGSLGALAFVPDGLPGAGRLKLASYQGGQWYDAEVVPDGSDTYDLVNVTPIPDAVVSGPEGIAYVNPGSAEFLAPSVLVSEYGSGRVSAFEVDANGDPVVDTRRDFVTGLSGAEGAFVDPVTGDFLFSTYGGGNRVIVVRGFARAATVSVVTEVVNDDGGVLGPADFNVHVLRDGLDVAGSPQAGSATGTPYTLTAGAEHTIAADPVPGYALSFSGDCPDGRVTPEEGVQKTCTIKADDIEPATLNVLTQVQGGLWIAEDFTVHVRADGLDAPGSPQPGSTEGTPAFSLTPGTYVVAEDGARGYSATVGRDCAADGTVTLASGDNKTCTIVNTSAPVGAGLVIESYGPSRTDSDWGLTESFLSDTRAYLQDPANFGPSGIVAGSLQAAPGIRVASTRVLAGVDVFFTGWVPSLSYTSDEKTALREFVLRGGTLIATTDDSSHTMVDVFGLEQGDGSGDPTVNTITNPGHPIASGPFGTVTSYNQYAATGHYTALGPNAHEVGRNDAGPSLAVIERGELGPNSGAAIFVADVDVFSDHGGATVNATLIKNIFAFATGQRAQPVLTIGDVSQAEGDAGATTFTFTVRLLAPSQDTVRVHYATADDTASAPSDYISGAADLEFAPGETAKSVSVTVNGDTAIEAHERFRMNLSGAVGARIADSQGVGTIANDDDVVIVIQAQQQPHEQELPPPEAGKNVNAVPKSGTVKVRLPGTKKFVELGEGQQIPVGTVIDTTKGRVTLVAASNKSGGTATADFYDGIFKVGQNKAAKPTTTLALVGPLDCGSRGKASAAAKKKKRRLWGDGSGNFQTKGKHSAATVVGTKWLVEDRCDSTLTKVARGKVEVRDFAKKKNVIVRAGKQYVARARR